MEEQYLICHDEHQHLVLLHLRRFPRADPGACPGPCGWPHASGVSLYLSSVSPANVLRVPSIRAEMRIWNKHPWSQDRLQGHSLSLMSIRTEPLAPSGSACPTNSLSICTPPSNPSAVQREGCSMGTHQRLSRSSHKWICSPSLVLWWSQSIRKGHWVGGRLLLVLEKPRQEPWAQAWTGQTLQQIHTLLLLPLPKQDPPLLSGWAQSLWVTETELPRRKVIWERLHSLQSEYLRFPSVSWTPNHIIFLWNTKNPSKVFWQWMETNIRVFF